MGNIVRVDLDEFYDLGVLDSSAVAEAIKRYIDEYNDYFEVAAWMSCGDYCVMRIPSLGECVGCTAPEAEKAETAWFDDFLAKIGGNFDYEDFDEFSVPEPYVGLLITDSHGFDVMILKPKD